MLTSDELDIPRDKKRSKPSQPRQVIDAQNPLKEQGSQFKTGLIKGHILAFPKAPPNNNNSTPAILIPMKKKCVFVIGPESTGSKLIGKICSHALDIENFGDWNGSGWSNSDQHKVCHRSLPYGKKCHFPVISEWIAEYGDDYDIYFVLTTRDITISQFSRYQRWKKLSKQSTQESETAKNIMLSVMSGEQPHFIWSYESFMFLGAPYLQTLYQFLGIESDFSPELYDANVNKVKKNRQSIF